ncbi:MAG: tetratricopeptide repeat protein [Bdellovibrionales bacterium]|nr:tetratricopeptide repeat protein [Bdellovibrionales bacterium]
MTRSTFFVCMMILFTGCLKTRADLRAENQDPTPQRQTVAQQRAERVSREAAPAAPVKAAPMTTAARFEEYDDQMRQLNGRLDVVENSVSQLAAAKQGEQSAQSKEIQAIDIRHQAYEEALKKMEAQIAALSEEVSRLKAPPPAPVAAAPAAGLKTRTPYDEGEAFFNTKKWKDAIDSYQKYRDTYPKGKSFADATYKIGAAFQELGMKDEAKLFFEEVKDKFPGSKEAKKAAIRLKSHK